MGAGWFKERLEQAKNVLKRTAIVSLFMVTPITMTACNFDFKVPDAITNTVDSFVESVNQPVDIIKDNVENLKDASVFIDQTDISDPEKLEEVLDNMYNTGTDIAEQNNIEFVKATLVRVVDGDTIVVELDGEQKKVRLIGIDTPESVASQEYLDRTGKENTEAGKTASEHTKDILKDFKEVYLQKDTSDTDRYGRLLRYVWLEQPDNANNTTEQATKMLNAVLIKDGYAELSTYPPDTMYKSDFEYIYKMSHSDGYDDNDYSEEYDR